MNEAQAVSVIVALFALRFMIPVALTFSFGYGLDRVAQRLGIALT